MTNTLQTTERLNPENFIYWLQGFAEIDGERPTEKQWRIIKEHLELCFSRVTYKEPTIGSVSSPYGMTIKANPALDSFNNVRFC